jgi:hypothetical protein
MKRYNLSKIMSRAWALFRKLGISFSEALHRAWLSAKAEPVNTARIEKAKAEAGITEQTNTWKGWKDLGYEVIHGSKALFGCTLIYGSKGDGASYKASFFGASQVQAIA